MKKFFLGTFFAFLALPSLNAQIPNGGFESWTNLGTYEDPDGFITLNALSFLGVPVTTFKSTTVHGGNYSCENRCIAYSGFGGPDTLCGLAIGVFDFTQRPLNVEGWYQLISSGVNHSCYLGVSLTKWNATDSIADTIAVGLYGTATPTDTVWNYFNLPLQYYSAAIPDSMQIIFGGSGDAGSLMRMDDLAFNGSVLSAQQSFELNVHLFPNPANNELQIYLANSSDYQVQFLNMEGEVLREMRWTGKEAKFGVEDITPGIYLLKISDLQSGTEITKRISVMR